MISTSLSGRAQLQAFLTGPLSLRLYTNDLGPDAVEVLRSEIIEAAGGGYQPIRLEFPRWKIEGLVGEEVAVYPTVGWIFNGQVGFIHGVFLLDERSDIVTHWEPLATPQFIRQAGDQVDIGRFTLKPKVQP